MSSVERQPSGDAGEPVVAIQGVASIGETQLQFVFDGHPVPLHPSVTPEQATGLVTLLRAHGYSNETIIMVFTGQDGKRRSRSDLWTAVRSQPTAERPTLEEVAEAMGVSRQAVQQATKKAGVVGVRARRIDSQLLEWLGKIDKLTSADIQKIIAQMVVHPEDFITPSGRICRAEMLSALGVVEVGKQSSPEVWNALVARGVPQDAVELGLLRISPDERYVPDAAKTIPAPEGSATLEQEFVNWFFYQYHKKGMSINVIAGRLGVDAMTVYRKINKIWQARHPGVPFARPGGARPTVRPPPDAIPITPQNEDLDNLPPYLIRAIAQRIQKRLALAGVTLGSVLKEIVRLGGNQMLKEERNPLIKRLRSLGLGRPDIAALLGITKDNVRKIIPFDASKRIPR